MPYKSGTILRCTLADKYVINKQGFKERYNEDVHRWLRVEEYDDTLKRYVLTPIDIDYYTGQPKKEYPTVVKPMIWVKHNCVRSDD